MHNEFTGDAGAVVQAGMICGPVTMSSHAASHLAVFLQAIDLLDAESDFKKVAALTTLLRLVEEFPDLLQSVLITLDQWIFPPEMAEAIGYAETIAIRMKDLKPYIQRVLKEFPAPPITFVTLHSVEEATSCEIK